MSALLAAVDSGAAAYQPLASPGLAPVLDLVRDPEPVLRLLARVPPAVCHNDLNPDNLLLRRGPDGEEVVALDWQMVGIAPVCADLSQLLCYVPATLDGRSREEVERSVVAEYVAALQECGFVLDTEAVAVAEVADGALRQALFGVYILCLTLDGAAELDEDGLRAVVADVAEATASGPVPDLARRALEHARASSPDVAGEAGWFAYGRPVRPDREPGGTS